MMRIVETKAYKVEFTTEDRKKFREVIEFLDDLADEIAPRQIEVKDPYGDAEICTHWDIDRVVALLTGLEEDDYVIIN